MSTPNSTFPNPRKEYYIRNLKGGTVMDIDERDRQCMKIVGNRQNGSKSQRWTVQPVPHGSEKYCIRNCKKAEERRAPCYLGTCEENDKLVLAMVEHEHKWEIDFKNEITAVQMIDTKESERMQHAAELGKGGSFAEGTPVRIARLEKIPQQYWMFVEVDDSNS